MDVTQSDSPRPPTPTRWVRGRSIAVACATLALVLVVVAAVTTPRQEVLQVWTQPASVVYDDGTTHQLAVVDRGRDWVVIGGGHRYALYSGSDPSLGYGHWLEIGLPDGAPALEGADVRWSPRGVRLRLPSGHETFVPAASFTGGR